MSYPVSNLIEGRGVPVTVKHNEYISKALLIMLENDYSQLPVVNEEDDILGMITYKKILRAIKYFKAGLNELVVQNAIEQANTFDLEDDIFDLLPSLQTNNAVLITGVGEKLIGIVTNYDTTEYFRNRAEDLMLIEEIELMIRDLIEFSFRNQNGEIDEIKMQDVIGRITDNVENLKKKFKAGLHAYLNLSNRGSIELDKDTFEESFLKVYKGNSRKTFDQLSLSDFIEILVYEDCWIHYGDIFNIDVKLLRNLLDEVRETRNYLSHFKGEISPEQRDNLRFCMETVEKAHETLEKIAATGQTEDDINTGEIEGEETIPPVGEETTKTISKYSPLEEYLMGIPGRQGKIRLSFREIEEILGDDRP